MQTIENIYKNKKLSANISLSVATIVVLFLLIELTFFCLNNFSADRTETIEKYCVNDPITGYKPQPDSSKHVIKRYKSGKIIYDVTYTTDGYGRRITKQKSKADSYVIYFGDSLIFGEGLDDEETLPYYFSTLTKSSVYNYGCSGYGPNMMLAQLSEKDLSSEIKEKKGIAVYLFIDNHIRRAIGDIYIDDRAPFFCLNKKD
ncbi:MAG: hypothetical protein PHW62_06795, partial [Candidatus Ratteibacteria bacterium]|nr:hypothetical protein [Candidatus Ratteibacteria bacterium]